MRWRQICLKRPNSHLVHPKSPFPYHKTPVQSPGSESRLKRQLEEQSDQITGFHADGSRGSRVIDAPKFSGILSGGGR